MLNHSRGEEKGSEVQDICVQAYRAYSRGTSNLWGGWDKFRQVRSTEDLNPRLYSIPLSEVTLNSRASHFVLACSGLFYVYCLVFLGPVVSSYIKGDNYFMWYLRSHPSLSSSRDIRIHLFILIVIVCLLEALKRFWWYLVKNNRLHSISILSKLLLFPLIMLYMCAGVCFFVCV